MPFHEPVPTRKLTFYTRLSTVSDPAARARFGGQCSLHDLKVNLGSWSWSEGAPRPPQQLLDRAPVWRSLDSRHIRIRDAFAHPKQEAVVVPSTAEDVVTMRLSESGTRCFTGYLAPHRENKSPAMPATLATLEFFAALVSVDGRPPAHQVRAAARSGTPIMLWGPSTQMVREASQELEKENVELRWVVLDYFTRPPIPMSFSTHSMRRSCIMVGAPADRLQQQVTTPVCCTFAHQNILPAYMNVNH